jgi:hypothetical protein
MSAIDPIIPDRPTRGRRVRSGRDRHARTRELRRVKQARYRRRRDDGLRVISFEADPTDVRDFLVEAGIGVPDLDAKTLGRCLMVMLDFWREGHVACYQYTETEDGS